MLLVVPLAHDPVVAGASSLRVLRAGFLADGRLALFDFGLAKLWRIGPDDQGGTEVRPLTGNTGSLRYMAPEVALSKAYSHRAEVRAAHFRRRSGAYLHPHDLFIAGMPHHWPRLLLNAGVRFRHISVADGLARSPLRGLRRAKFLPPSLPCW